MVCFFALAVYEVEPFGAMLKQGFGQKTTYSPLEEDDDGGGRHALIR